MAEHFFGNGGGAADRPAVEPVGAGRGKKPFKQQAIKTYAFFIIF